MNRTKKLLALSGVFLAFSCFLMVLESCQNEEGYEVSSQNSESDSFLATFFNSYDNVAKCGVSRYNPRKRASLITDSVGANVGNDSLGNLIFIGLPGSEVDSLDIIKRRGYLDSLMRINALKQLVLYSDSIGAEITYSREDVDDIAFQINEEEALNTLRPMIVSAKNYLYAKGFTEDEIQNMLVENSIQECNLVEIVIGLIEYEKQDLAHVTYNSPYSLGFSAYAFDINWSKVAICAYQTVGGDLIDEIAKSGAKKLTKAVIKKAVKVVAKRMCGPVGAAIAVIEFGICMNE